MFASHHHGHHLAGTGGEPASGLRTHTHTHTPYTAWEEDSLYLRITVRFPFQHGFQPLYHTGMVSRLEQCVHLQQREEEERVREEGGMGEMERREGGRGGGRGERRE